MKMMTWNIIDSDRHVSEPNSIWLDYLSSDFWGYLPSYTHVTHLEDGNPLPEFEIQGKSIFRKWSERARQEAAQESLNCQSAIQQGETPEAQIQSMDEQGIEKAVLFPTYAKFIVNNENLEKQVSVAFAEAYNRWLKDYCTYHPKRLLGVGVVSRFDPQAMLFELQRIFQFGWKIVVLRPEMLMGRVLGHPDYEPFWEKCESLGITVAIHGGSHIHAPTIGMDRFETHFALHACSHPMEIQMAFLSLLEAGVLERYPKLQFAFMEAGASWLPHWLWRLDEICYKALPGEISEHIKIEPSAYFRRQCWVGFEIGEPCLKEVVQMVGIERLLFGTDFPHPDHLHFQLDDLQKIGFSDNEMRTILEENPKKCFRLAS